VQGKDFLVIRHLCLTAQGKALAALSVSWHLFTHALAWLHQQSTPRAPQGLCPAPERYI